MPTLRIKNRPGVTCAIIVPEAEPGTATLPVMTMAIEGLALKDLQMVLHRALNTWEPDKIPPWTLDLADALNLVLNPPKNS